MSPWEGILGSFREIGQSALSLSFNMGGVIAGALLALHIDVFRSTPWAFLLFPSILGVRGAVGGFFSGHMSTALHVGTIRPSLTENTESLQVLLSTVVTLTLVSSVMMGVSASLFGTLLLNTSLWDFLSMMAAVVTTMALSLAFLSPITLGISIYSFKRGLNPDVVIYPAISTVADILVTICYVLVLEALSHSHAWRGLLGCLDLLFLALVGFLFFKNHGKGEFVRNIKEFSLTLLMVALIVNVTGSALDRMSHLLGERPGVYVAYPALIGTVGSVGSIVGSTATTKLALGLMRSSFSSIKEHLGEISRTWAASFLMFTLYALLPSLLYPSTGLTGCWELAAQLLVTNLMAVFLIVASSFAVTIFTQKRGWDPDNFVIPISSSLADAATTVSLLVATTMID